MPSCLAIPRRRSKAVDEARPSIFDKLSDDILDIIIELLWEDSYEACNLLSLTCHRLYRATVPWIYRHVTINFTRNSHLQLLQRLIQNNSKLPPWIRELKVKKVYMATPVLMSCLSLLLKRMTNLWKLTWNGFIDIPVEVLDTMRVKFPRAELIIKGCQLSVGDPPGPSTTVHLDPKNVFTHMPHGHLTRFSFYPSESEQLFDTFKFYLLRMLVASPKLERLVISSSIQDDTHWPEMLLPFQLATLPRLKVFTLLTDSVLFTQQELDAWGHRGGWKKLTDLSLSRPLDLLSFVHRVPRLEVLTLYAIRSRSWEMDDLEDDLETLEPGCLGPVTSFTYRRGMLTKPVPRNVMIPWCILSKLESTVTELQLHHFPIRVFNDEFETLSSQDLRDLRKALPKLTELSLDLQILDDGWPTPILSELALFKDMDDLYIYVHQPYAKEDTRGYLNPRRCKKAFDYMMKTRETSKIVTSGSSPKVGFKVVLPSDIMENHWTPDFSFRLDPFSRKLEKQGELMGGWWPERQGPYDYSHLDLQDLNKIRLRCIFWGVTRLGICADRKIKNVANTYYAVVKQRERLKYGERARRVFGDGVTLFDRLG
jgi:hypothetical protein